jgi:uracil-DNA glycosylase
MLIGDGGSPSDSESNYALTGQSEILLNQLASGAFSMKDTWRTLLIKERINANDFDAYSQLVTEEYKEILRNEIKEIQPNLIIPIGEASFRFLRPDLHSIRKFRGSVLSTSVDGRTYKILPVLGPNPYLNQAYELRWVTQIDLQKAPRYAQDDVPPPDETINCWIAKSASSLRAFLERSYDEKGKLAFDIETYGGIPTCISFCFDGRESVCVPFMDRNIDLDNRVLMVQLVARILASKIKKGNQNITYDWRILGRFNFRVENITFDTSLGSTVLIPEMERNLGFLTSIYTSLPYFKNEGKEFDPRTVKGRDQFYLYNAKDSLAAWQIDEKQQVEVDEIGSRYVYDSSVKLIPIYKKMEDRGLRVDDERRQVLLAKYNTRFDIEVLKFRRLTDPGWNPMSSVQMNKFVFDELGFKKDRFVKDTGEESLEYLMMNQEAKRSPILGKQTLQIIINCRKLHKVIEHLNVIPYPDGRWRATYNLGGAETGRTTSGKNKTEKLIVFNGKKCTLETLGHSFQNIGKHGFRIDGEYYGKDIRSIYVPSPGYIYVECDLSQAEARVDAVLAGNFAILDIFDGPIGIHRLTGGWIYSCDPSSIKKNTEEYHIAKVARHAGERNMFPPRLVLMSGSIITLKEAKKILETFHSNQPELREVFHRDIRAAIDANRTLVSPNGRTRQFLGRIDQRLYNEAISQLPQSIVSDQLKFSLPQTLSEFPEAWLINEAHDGCLAEVPIGRELEYGAIFKRNVETPIDFERCTLSRRFELTIPCEVSVSKGSWQDMEEVEV